MGGEERVVNLCGLIVRQLVEGVHDDLITKILECKIESKRHGCFVLFEREAPGSPGRLSLFQMLQLGRNASFMMLESDDFTQVVKDKMVEKTQLMKVKETTKSCLLMRQYQTYCLE